MKYDKWRDLSIDLFDIQFSNLKLKKIISYPPAGNDVVEVICEINNNQKNAFIKYERSKMADFESEYKNINIINDNNYYDKTPKIYEIGIFKSKIYIVLSKIEGARLSEIFEKNNLIKNDYLFKYGAELAHIHNIPYEPFSLAKQRIINDLPKEEIYKFFDENISKYITYLEKNKPLISYDTFIHGDFHYANILWKNNKIEGVIDFEYSGRGFREQDIAWSIILRPAQHFMDNINDLNQFLKGYKSISKYDKNKLKWCLINGYCHFYLMNMNNNNYKYKIMNILKELDKLV